VQEALRSKGAQSNVKQRTCSTANHRQTQSSSESAGEKMKNKVEPSTTSSQPAPEKVNFDKKEKRFPPSFSPFAQFK
jgi:hypothetical protein